MSYTVDRPYLWGSAGSSHYSIKSNLTLTLSTQPSVDSVIECLDRDLLHKSAYNLPLHRQLSPAVSHYPLSPYRVEPCHPLSKFHTGCHQVTAIAALDLETEHLTKSSYPI